jgi:DNA-binding MarR family transcriptional regulator
VLVVVGLRPRAGLLGHGDRDLVSEKLFGSELRLRVAFWVHRRGKRRFFQAEAADGVRYSASAVAAELDRLIELGMLKERSAETGDRRRYYQRIDSPMWKIIEAAEEVVEPRPASQEGGRGSRGVLPQTV